MVVGPGDGVDQKTTAEGFGFNGGGDVFFFVHAHAPLMSEIGVIPDSGNSVKAW